MSLHASLLPTDSTPLVAVSHQSEVDRMMAEVRAELAASPPVALALVPTASADEVEVGTNLARAILLLEALEDALCDDPAILAAHGERLQNLDAALQYLKAADASLGTR